MSLINFELNRDVTPGTYTTRIESFREVHNEGRKPYIEVTMNIDNLVITDRWYANNLPYIMSNIRAQLDAVIEPYAAVSLQSLLSMAMSSYLDVTVSYDPKYGRQISYRV